MSYCTIHFVIGELPDGTPGQWIEADVLIAEPERFTFSADLCRQSEDAEFSLYRVTTVVDQPLSALLALSLLTLVAEPPFAPSENGLKVYVEGESALAGGEVARFVEPEVRRYSCPELVPAPLAMELREQLALASKYRTIIA